jgi:hypothetical protein
MAAISRLEDLGHAELAVLCREYFLCGQLIDRAGMPQLISRWGRDEMRDVAIDEWMGASPVYTARMQRAMGFSGDTVATIFKGMQLDVGAPPEFLDFRYVAHDDDHGEFWLDHCGALADVEPMGDDYVRAMCHDIEDPTFEATACASNPRAVMAPVHRPPRVPADRHPHCHWTVHIDRDKDPLSTPAGAELIGSTLAAATVIEPFGTDGAGADDPDDRGWPDYSGALDADLRMEDFSRRALSVIAQEAALQAHLLTMSFLAAVDRRHGTDAALDVGSHQFTGSAGIAAERLARAMGTGGGLEGIARVFELHPAFQPRSYVAWSVTLAEDAVLLEMGDCPARSESAALGWVGMLEAGVDMPIAAAAAAVDPTATFERVDPDRPGGLAWRVTLGDTPVRPFDDVTLAKFSSGAEFRFRRVGRRC